jgi:DNA-binding response OmpR family regulator
MAAGTSLMVILFWVVFSTSGMDDYLSKPLQISQLEAVLSRSPRITALRSPSASGA